MNAVGLHQAMADGLRSPGTPGAEEGIRLDPSVIKALAADSRREILRSLKGRRKTVSELAKELGLQKATVAEHLKRLVDAGLVARIEDERLWVYHELTPTGRGLLEPGRSRVFLVLGVVLIGLLSVVLVMGLYVYLVEMPGGGFVAIEPDVKSFHTATPVEFTIDKHTDLDPDPAYLESTDGATRAPLIVTDDGDRWRLRSETSLPAGAYRLRFEDREPTFDAPRLDVHRIRVSAPSTEWWRGLDGDLVLQVQAGGRPLDGVLYITPAQADNATPAQLPAAVEDGQATIPAAMLDAWPTGEQTLLFEADPHSGTAEVDGRLVVAAPRPQVAPQTLVATRSDAVHVFLAVAGGEEPERVPLLLDGVAVQAEPQSRHHLRVPVDADRPGLRTLQVGRITNMTLTVHPDLALDVAIIDGPQWRLRVSTSDGPATGMPVAIDGARVGTTGADGQLTVAIPQPGPHVLTLEAATGPIDRTFQAVGWRFVERTPDVVLDVDDDSVMGRSLILTYSNFDDMAYDATIVGESAGAWTASTVRLDARSTNTTRLDLYPPMGGELRLFAITPPYRPIIVTNETDDGGSGSPTATTTTTGTTATTSPPAEPDVLVAGRAITRLYEVEIPEQSTPSPHEDDLDGDDPAAVDDAEQEPQEKGALTVLIVLGVVLIVTVLYLMRGRRGA